MALIESRQILSEVINRLSIAIFSAQVNKTDVTFERDLPFGVKPWQCEILVMEPPEAKKLLRLYRKALRSSEGARPNRSVHWKGELYRWNEHGQKDYFGHGEYFSPLVGATKKTQ